MPSMIFAAGLMALSGMATAMPQLYTNTTLSGVNGTSSVTAGAAATTGTASSNTTTSALAESLFCPALNGAVLESATGSDYLLECSTNHYGTIIDVVSNTTVAKRAIVAPANIEDCMAACDLVSVCVGTAFNTAAQTCILFSDVGAAFTDAGVDFAVKISSAAASTLPAGATATSTIYSTNVQTISSCAPTVTDCPLNAAGGVAVVTQVVAVASTEYICPTASVVAVAPIACDCAYSASTATVYSVSGSTVVPVQTSVVAVISPAGTSYSTTTVAGSAAMTTAPMTVAAASATASAMNSIYTGAASNVKAGMGLLAGVGAAAAFML